MAICAEANSIPAVQPRRRMVTFGNVRVTGLCAEGQGWSHAAAGQPAWEACGFTVTLEGPGLAECAFRSGADAGRRAAQFATLLSALDTGRSVNVTVADPGDGDVPSVVQVVLPVQ